MNILIINNIQKKRGKKLYKLVKEEFPEIEIINTNKKEEIKNAIAHIIEKNIDRIICGGGDGTLNYLINELTNQKEKFRKKISLGIIPTGTANDLAKKMKIPKNLKKAIELALNGKEKQIDIAKVNKKYFLTGGGFGVPSKVIKEKEKYIHQNKLNKKVYIYLVLKIFLKKCKELKKFIFMKKEYKNSLVFSVMNQEFIGGVFNLIPDAKNDDGYLNFSIIQKSNKPFGNIYRLLLLLLKKHSNKNWTKTFRLQHATIEFRNKKYFMADGELLEKNKKFKFSILPKEISIIC